MIIVPVYSKYRSRSNGSVTNADVRLILCENESHLLTMIEGDQSEDSWTDDHLYTIVQGARFRLKSNPAPMSNTGYANRNLYIYNALQVDQISILLPDVRMFDKPISEDTVIIKGGFSLATVTLNSSTVSIQDVNQTGGSNQFEKGIYVVTEEFGSTRKLERNEAAYTKNDRSISVVDLDVPGKAIYSSSEGRVDTSINTGQLLGFEDGDVTLYSYDTTYALVSSAGGFDAITKRSIVTLEGPGKHQLIDLQNGKLQIAMAVLSGSSVKAVLKESDLTSSINVPFDDLHDQLRVTNMAEGNTAQLRNAVFDMNGSMKIVSSFSHGDLTLLTMENGSYKTASLHPGQIGILSGKTSGIQFLGSHNIDKLALIMRPSDGDVSIIADGTEGILSAAAATLRANGITAIVKNGNEARVYLPHPSSSVTGVNPNVSVALTIRDGKAYISQMVSTPPVTGNNSDSIKILSSIGLVVTGALATALGVLTSSGTSNVSDSNESSTDHGPSEGSF